MVVKLSVSKRSQSRLFSVCPHGRVLCGKGVPLMMPFSGRLFRSEIMTRHCWDGGGEKDVTGFGAWEEAEVPKSNLRQQGRTRPLHSDRSASFPPA